MSSKSDRVLAWEERGYDDGRWYDTRAENPYRLKAARDAWQRGHARWMAKAADAFEVDRTRKLQKCDVEIARLERQLEHEREARESIAARANPFRGATGANS